LATRDPLLAASPSLRPPDAKVAPEQFRKSSSPRDVSPRDPG
jgi:hypothetical protein